MFLKGGQSPPVYVHGTLLSMMLPSRQVYHAHYQFPLNYYAGGKVMEACSKLHVLQHPARPTIAGIQSIIGMVSMKSIHFLVAGKSDEIQLSYALISLTLFRYKPLQGIKDMPVVGKAVILSQICKYGRH